MLFHTLIFVIFGDFCIAIPLSYIQNAKSDSQNTYIVMFKEYIWFTFDTNSRLKGPLVTYQIDKYQTCNLDSRQVAHTNLNLIHAIYILLCSKNIEDQRVDVSNTFPCSECCGSLE